jgi:cupin 2 domain-containing protein
MPFRTPVVAIAASAEPAAWWMPAARSLRTGDFVDIAAHRRHRVEWMHPTEPTVWLAVHYD